MSPPSIRRAAERKQRKLERKQLRVGAAANPAVPAPEPVGSLESEFSPELIAEAQAARQRIEARLAAHRGASQPQPEKPAAPARTRAAINRANSLRSTGPVTPEGKLVSSRNSLKHGLASGELIILGEDPAAFEALTAALLQEHRPASTTEEMLVRQMAQSHWLEQRAIRLQNECFTPEGLDEKRLALFLRYQTTHQRAFYKALHELNRLRKERRRAASAKSRGFVSQDPPTGFPDPGFVSQNTAPHPLFASPEPANTAPKPALTALNQNHPLSHQLYGR